MFVSADVNNNYLLKPTQSEYRAFRRWFDKEVVECDQGYTFAIYEYAPTIIVKGVSYYGALADKTRSFDTAQEALTYLHLMFSLKGGQMLNSTKGLRLSSLATITGRPDAVVFNHFPQLFEVYQKDKYLVSFVGHFDFDSQLFKGQAQFKTTGEIWGQ